MFPIGVSHTTRIVSPFRTTVAPSSRLVPTSEPSEPERRAAPGSPTVSPTPDATEPDVYAPAPAAHHVNWRAAAAFAFMTASGTALMLAGPPAPPPVSVGVCWAADGSLAAGKCADLFSQMSPQGQEMYRGMGPTLKGWFDKNVNGRAAVIIDKRATFIKGNWHGYDAFKFVDGQIANKQKDGSLSPADANRAHQIVDVCRSMTEDQRSAFVQLLDLDTGRKK